MTKDGFVNYDEKPFVKLFMSQIAVAFGQINTGHTRLGFRYAFRHLADKIIMVFRPSRSFVVNFQQHLNNN